MVLLAAVFEDGRAGGWRAGLVCQRRKRVTWVDQYVGLAATGSCQPRPQDRDPLAWRASVWSCLGLCCRQVNGTLCAAIGQWAVGKSLVVGSIEAGY